MLGLTRDFATSSKAGVAMQLLGVERCSTMVFQS